MMNLRRVEADIRPDGRESGVTMIELMVACFISLVFILAAGTGYLVNQKAYKANREKLELQQTAAHVMEMMERRIREASRVTIPSPNNRITTYDVTNTQVTYFRLNTSGTQTKLFEQNTLLAKQDLIQLSFTPNSDTTVVTIVLNLQDVNKNKVGLRGSAAVRNSAVLRYFRP